MKRDNINILGMRLKATRLQKGLTQSKLAENICTQALISNLEKGVGNENPSSQTLYLLSERLNVSMSYLYGQDNYVFSDVENELGEAKILIEKAKARRDYITLKYIVENEMKNVATFNFKTTQYLEWHRALYIYNLEKDYIKAKEIISKALIPETVNTNLDIILQNINIELSHAVILNKEREYAAAEEIIKACLEKYELTNNSFSVGELDIHLQNKIIFNLSVSYVNRQMYQEALEICLDAIKRSKDNNYMGLLGDLLFQAGHSYIKQNSSKKGLKLIREALSVLEIQGNIEMTKIVEDYLKEN